MSVVRPIGTLALSSLAKKAHFISRRYFFKVFDCCAEFLVNMFGIGIILCSDELYWHSCSMPFTLQGRASLCNQVKVNPTPLNVESIIIELLH